MQKERKTGVETAVVVFVVAVFVVFVVAVFVVVAVAVVVFVVVTVVVVEFPGKRQYESARKQTVKAISDTDR